MEAGGLAPARARRLSPWHSRPPRAAQASVGSARSHALAAHPSSLILVMIGWGVPTGATRICQPVAEKPGKISATVGRPGNSARGSSDATAIALTEPD